MARKVPGLLWDVLLFPGLVKHSGGNARRAVRRVDPGIRRDRDMKETVVEAVRITAGQGGSSRSCGRNGVSEKADI